MKRLIRITAAFCMAALLAVQTAVTAAADIGEIFAGFSRDGSFFDGLEFGDNDWAALCHIRLNGAEGAQDYLASVKSGSEELMQSDGFVKPTELQRASIVLSAAGECSEELMNAAVFRNNNLERQGLNAYIWGLIAINCSGAEAPEGALNTRRSLVDYILSKQLSDGGFSLKGSSADTDITAAAIYALAPLGESEALVRAEQCLREMQLPSGGYMSVGVECCESAAQAVVAFAALGHGCEDEQAAAALEAMRSYKMDDGYSHLPDGESNGMAAMQALQALTALELMERGEALYSAPAVVESSEQQVSSVETIPQTEESTVESTVTGFSLKFVIGGGLILAGVVWLVVLLVRKSRRMIALPLLIVAAGAAVLLLDIRTPEEYYAESAGGSMQVTLSVDCTAALEYGADVQLPQNGMLLDSVTVYLPEGATAFDALVEAAKPQQLRVDYDSGAFGEYVTGIGSLTEFGCGSESGWLYSVNGVFPSASSGAYALSEGDYVEFVYTCALGQYNVG